MPRGQRRALARAQEPSGHRPTSLHPVEPCAAAGFHFRFHDFQFLSAPSLRQAQPFRFCGFLVDLPYSCGVLVC